MSNDILECIDCLLPTFRIDDMRIAGTITKASKTPCQKQRVLKSVLKAFAPGRLLDKSFQLIPLPLEELVLMRLRDG